MATANAKRLLWNLRYTKTIDIIVFAGQSNMKGIGDYTQSVSLPLGHSYEYRFLQNEIIQVSDPMGEDMEGWRGYNDTPDPAVSGSLVPAFLKGYKDRSPNRTVIAIHSARGGSSLGAWMKGSDLYEITVEKVSEAKGYIDNLPNATLGRVFYVWLQGEQQAYNGQSKADYKNNMTLFHNDFMTDIGAIGNGMMIRIGKLPVTYCNQSEYEAIMLGQNELTQELSDLTMVSKITSTFTIENGLKQSDDIHYTQEGLNTVGEDAGWNTADFLATGTVPVLSDNVFS